MSDGSKPSPSGDCIVDGRRKVTRTLGNTWDFVFHERTPLKSVDIMALSHDKAGGSTTIYKNIMIMGVACFFLIAITLMGTSSIFGGRLTIEKSLPTELQVCTTNLECRTVRSQCGGPGFHAISRSNLERFREVKQQMCIDSEGNSTEIVAMWDFDSWPKSVCQGGTCVLNEQSAP